MATGELFKEWCCTMKNGKAWGTGTERDWDPTHAGQGVRTRRQLLGGWFCDNERHGVDEEKSADGTLIEEAKYRKGRGVSLVRKRKRSDSSSSGSDSE